MIVLPMEASVCYMKKAKANNSSLFAKLRRDSMFSQAKDIRASSD